MSCISCGVHNAANVTFCPHCGTRQPENPAGVEGSPQAAWLPQPAVTPPPPPPPPPGPRRRGGLVLVAVLAVVVAAAGVVLVVLAPWKGTERAASGDAGAAGPSGAPVDGEQPTVDADPHPVEQPVWSVATLTPLLAAVADDEAESWGYFAPDSIVAIPCGGEGAHGAATDLVERTGGGVDIGASAEIFADPEAAARELERLLTLVEECGPHDYIMRNGTVFSACAAPDVAALEPVIRFEQSCSEVSDGEPWGQAIMQSGNAVVALSADPGDLDGLLSALLDALAAGPGDGAGAGAAQVTTDPFITDWFGTASGQLYGELAMQVGQYDPTAGPYRQLTGDISFRDMDCYGYWDEISRDDTSVTIQVDMDSGQCGTQLTATLSLDGSGQLLVDGGTWTGVLDSE